MSDERLQDHWSSGYGEIWKIRVAILNSTHIYFHGEIWNYSGTGRVFGDD